PKQNPLPSELFPYLFAADRCGTLTRHSTLSPETLGAFRSPCGVEVTLKILPSLRCLPAPQVVDKSLLIRFVVGTHDVADTLPADQQADFLGEVLGMISRPLQRLCHEEDVETLRARRVVMVLEVAQEYQVADSIQLCIGTQHIHGAIQIAQLHGIVHV